MALRTKTTLLLILSFSSIFASTNVDLFFTDKYDSNYFSSSNISKTEIHIGSDLFRFIKEEDLTVFGNFIDSFLKTENAPFNPYISFENNNSLRIQLNDCNAVKCNQLSKYWFEEYNIAWIKLLMTHLSLDEIPENNSQIMILKKLYTDEALRSYNVTNIVNNTLLAFVIPKNLSSNQFKKSKIYLNTKRYTSNESEFNYTEIITNNQLAENELIFNFPSYNKQTLLKNSISLHIIKRLLIKNQKIALRYGIAQSFIRYSLKNDSTNFEEFKINLDDLAISKENFIPFLNDAIDEILTEISKDNLFFYSYYDKLKLEQMRNIYSLEDFYNEVEILERKTKFIVEINARNKLSYKNIKLEEVHFTDFKEGISFKTNSIKFRNNVDTLLIPKLNLFLALNKNYKLTIVSSAKKTEYLFISNSQKEEILDKYKESDYVISHKKKLKLYRSLVIFNELINLNIEATRLNCIGIRNDYSKVNFEFIMSN